MKRLFLSLVTLVAAASVAIAGCGQAPPPPTPTKAPAAPTKAAEPTKPAAATAAPTKAPEPTKPAAAPTAVPAPTAAPAAKVSFPEKGKSISFIVPFAAGGAADVGARLVASLMEKDLGASVQVANKPGASSQIGLTEVATSKPDGYTMGLISTWTGLTTYLDAERKAVYSRKDLLPVATLYSIPYAVSVKADSPYKTLKDLLDAAKANPEKIKAGTTGRLGMGHLVALQVAKAGGVKFAAVHFDGGAPQLTALLGGHIDVAFNVVPELVTNFKSGNIRVLGLLDKAESRFLPGVKTMESQGYKLNAVSMGGVIAPGATPRGIVDVLDGSIKKAVGSDEYKKKMEEFGFDVVYLNSQQFAKFWDEEEPMVKQLLDEAKLQQ